MIAPRLGVGLGRGVVGRVGRPLLIWVLGHQRWSGDEMAIGVSRRARPLVLGRLSSVGRQQQGCRELAAGSSAVGRETQPDVQDSGGSVVSGSGH